MGECRCLGKDNKDTILKTPTVCLLLFKGSSPRIPLYLDHQCGIQSNHLDAQYLMSFTEVET